MIELVGIGWTPATPKPGELITVTASYRALDLPPENYKAFVHIEGAGGRSQRINGDHWIAQNRYPTSVWRMNDLVVDSWSFRAPSAGGQKLEIWTGLFLPDKDERLPLRNKSEVRNDGNNRVMAASIPME